MFTSTLALESLFMSQIRAAGLSDRSSIIGPLLPFHRFSLPHFPARVHFSPSPEKK